MKQIAVEPRLGLLIPPWWGAMCEKKPVLAYELFFKYGGEGGIRTPDTLPYTHFPGVLLQPLGHLTILSFPLSLGTGANLGKYVSLVNQLFLKSARLAKLHATCWQNARQSFFLSPLSFCPPASRNLLCWQTNRKQQVKYGANANLLKTLAIRSHNGDYLLPPDV